MDVTGVGKSQGFQMKCGDVKREVALHLGHDRCEPFALKEVRRHLAGCPDCRRRYQQLKETLPVFEKPELAESYEVQGSIWPALEARLDAPRVRPGERLRRNIVPVASAVAAAALFLFVCYTTPAPKSPAASHDAGFTRGSVTFWPWWPEFKPSLSNEAREARQRALRQRGFDDERPLEE